MAWEEGTGLGEVVIRVERDTHTLGSMLHAPATTACRGCPQQFCCPRFFEDMTKRFEHLEWQ